MSRTATTNTTLRVDSYREKVAALTRFRLFIKYISLIEHYTPKVLWIKQLKYTNMRELLDLMLVYVCILRELSNKI